MTAKKKPAAVKQEEVYKPMAVQEPTQLERLEVAEMQINLIKGKLNELYRQHHMRDAI
jgi:hypothetical protein